MNLRVMMAAVVWVFFITPDPRGVPWKAEITTFPISDREFTLETRRSASSFDDMIANGVADEVSHGSRSSSPILSVYVPLSGSNLFTRLFVSSPVVRDRG